MGPEKAMQLTWDMIGRARRDSEGYLLYLKPGTPPEGTAAWRAWMARAFDVPVFLQLPLRIFSSPNDVKLFEAMLRRKTRRPPKPARPPYNTTWPLCGLAHSGPTFGTAWRLAPESDRINYSANFFSMKLTHPLLLAVATASLALASCSSEPSAGAPTKNCARHGSPRHPRLGKL